jgi:D-alanyl-lipoteichoic acid acyltransferase DltB (MBOAT superfamily)
MLWLAEAVPASITNSKPASVAAIGLPANVVHGLDLGLVIPAVLLTAHWLRQGRAWGFVLTGVLFVKVISISLAVLAMIAWMTVAGEPVAVVEIAVFGLITVVGAAVGFVYFRSLSAVKAAEGGEERPEVASG